MARAYDRRKALCNKYDKHLMNCLAGAILSSGTRPAPDSATAGNGDSPSVDEVYPGGRALVGALEAWLRRFGTRSVLQVEGTPLMERAELRRHRDPEKHLRVATDQEHPAVGPGEVADPFISGDLASLGHVGVVEP